MNMLKTALLLLLLAAGGNALGQQPSRQADTMEYRMLDSSDADNIALPNDDMAESAIDTGTLNATDGEDVVMDEEDMTMADKMRHGLIPHSLYDRQPVDGFDESSQMRLTPRNPDSAALAKIRNDKDFQYPPFKPTGDRRPQWLKNIAAWAAENFHNIRIAFFCSLGLLLIVAIILFMNKNDIPVFRWRSKKKVLAGESAEEVTVTDLEEMARMARSAGQLREAVRLRYLHTLQLLESAGLIIRTKDKTNMDYLRELGRTAFHQSFAAITLQYEYVWYGKMPLSELQFGRVYAAFDDFKHSLSNQPQ